MRRCEKMWEDVQMRRCDDRPPLLEDPFAQTLSGIRFNWIWWGLSYQHVRGWWGVINYKWVFTDYFRRSRKDHGIEPTNYSGDISPKTHVIWAWVKLWNIRYEISVHFGWFSSRSQLFWCELHGVPGFDPYPHSQRKTYFWGSDGYFTGVRVPKWKGFHFSINPPLPPLIPRS